VQIFHNDQTSSWSSVFNFYYKMVKLVAISIFITINKRTGLPISQNNCHYNISQSPNYNSSTLSPILNTSTLLVSFAFTKQAKMTTKTTKNLVPSKQIVPLPLVSSNAQFKSQQSFFSSWCSFPPNSSIGCPWQTCYLLNQQHSSYMHRCFGTNFIIDSQEEIALLNCFQFCKNANKL